MTDRARLLRIALIVFGVAFMLVYPLMLVWPSGWRWSPSQHEYEQMIVGIYATLGAFLLWASREPDSHMSLIWFTVWSSVVHAVITSLSPHLAPEARKDLRRELPKSLWEDMDRGQAVSPQRSGTLVQQVGEELNCPPERGLQLARVVVSELSLASPILGREIADSLPDTFGS